MAKKITGATKNPMYVLSMESTRGITAANQNLMPQDWRVSPIKIDVFRQSYDDVLANIQEMCDQAKKLTRGYHIHTITFKMSVSAEGQLAFLAKAGIQADIEIVVKDQD